MIKRAKLFYSFVCTVATAPLLTACGGGGSQPASIPAPPPAVPSDQTSPPAPVAPPVTAPTSPSTGGYDTAEYRNSNGSAAHGAISAYEQGASGRGVKVAILDTGVSGTLDAFKGRIDAASQDVVWDGQYDRGVTDTVGHGTAVAAILAGARDNQLGMGVAYDSTILSLNTATCDVWRQCQHYHSDLAKALDIARENGAKVVNMSLDGGAIGQELLSAIDKATKAGLVIVVSAGNDNAMSPSEFALNTAQIAGNGNVIIAGAMDGDRKLASFSNSAGAGADFFLVALGAGINAHDQYGNAGTYNGTSYSAPVISGAAALLASAFPNLTGRQIVEILLASADDAGDAGKDYLYGNGILNIERAFAPQGEVKMAGLGMAVSPAMNVTASPAMGDASATGASAVVLDRYDRAYQMNLAATVARSPVSHPLASVIRDSRYQTSSSAAGPIAVSVTSFQGGQRASLVGATSTWLNEQVADAARVVAGVAMSRLSPRSKVALGIGESSYSLQQRLSNAAGRAFLIARDPLSQPGFFVAPASSAGYRQMFGKVGVTVTSEAGRVSTIWRNQPREGRGYTSSGITFDQQRGPHRFALGLSRMVEDRTLLGGDFSSAFFSGKASSLFADANADLSLGSGWSTSLNWRTGMTSAPSSGALVQDGRLWTNAFSLDVAKVGAFGAGDMVGFRVSQPLRVANGGFGMSVPVSFDYATMTPGFERRFFNLAPKGREIDYELSYATQLFTGRFSANAFVRTEPGHIETQSSDIGAAFRFAASF